MSSLDDCLIVELPQNSDERGSLTSIESAIHVPFSIKRVFYLYDIPHYAIRGAHAHREVQQLIIVVAGAGDVELDDGYAQQRHTLNSPALGLLVQPMIWGKLECFSPGAVCIVLASAHFDESDYIRDYNEFLSLVRT